MTLEEACGTKKRFGMLGLSECPVSCCGDEIGGRGGLPHFEYTLWTCAVVLGDENVGRLYSAFLLSVGRTQGVALG